MQQGYAAGRDRRTSRGRDAHRPAAGRGAYLGSASQAHRKKHTHTNDKFECILIGTLNECSRERSLQTCGSSLFNKLRLKAEEGKINLVFVPPALQKSVSIQQILVDDADAG